jgi:hypothetical protein
MPFGNTADSIARVFDTFLLLILGSLIALWAAVNAVLYFQIVRPTLLGG